MDLKGKFKQIGTSLLAWWGAHVSVQALGLASLEWQKHMQPSPVFPADPAADLPRAYLRAYIEDYAWAATLGCDVVDFTYRFSIWVQLLQTPGQEHQQLLLDAIAAFRDPILQAGFRPELGVAGLELRSIVPTQGVVQDETVHPLGALRVSNGELNVTLTGRLHPS